MDKQKVLKEFEGKCMRKMWTGEDYKYFLTPNIEVIREFIADLLDEAEKEKHEAVQLGYDKAHKEIAKAYIEIEEKELNK